MSESSYYNNLASYSKENNIGNSMATLKENANHLSHNVENGKLGEPTMKMNLRSSKYANNRVDDCAGNNQMNCNAGGMGMPTEGASQRRGLRDITNQTKQVGLQARSNLGNNQYQQPNNKYKNPGLKTMVYNENIEEDRMSNPNDRAVHKSKGNSQNTISQTSKKSI